MDKHLHTHIRQLVNAIDHISDDIEDSYVMHCLNAAHAALVASYKTGDKLETYIDLAVYSAQKIKEYHE